MLLSRTGGKTKVYKTPTLKRSPKQFLSLATVPPVPQDFKVDLLQVAYKAPKRLGC